MKVLVVKAPGIIGYEELEKPVPGPHEVVSKVVCCGICGTDVEIYHGDTSLARNGMLRYPIRIGHEWAGVVESVGSEVRDFAPGDRVISDTGSTCGQCEACLSGNFRQCKAARSLGTAGDYKPGAFAEYIVMYDWHLHRIPDNLSFEEAALVEPGTIAYMGLLDCQVGPGTVLAITGTGAIGLEAVTLARHMGAKVLLAGRRPMKLEVGRQLGADEVIDLSRQPLAPTILELTDGRGADVFFETTGNARFAADALNATVYNGTIGLVGFYEEGLEGFDVNRLVMEHKRLQGCEGSGWRAQQVLDMLARGEICVKPIITRRIGFSEAADAIRHAREDRSDKIKTMVFMD